MNFSKPYAGVKFFGVWAEETADIFGRRDALAVLHEVRDRCREQDMRNEHTSAAIAFLEAGATRKAPFRAFQEAIDMMNPESRWQNVNAALNSIERILSTKDGR